MDILGLGRKPLDRTLSSFFGDRLIPKGAFTWRFLDSLLFFRSGFVTFDLIRIYCMVICEGKSYEWRKVGKSKTAYF
jgi:hypothetical protein